MKEFKWVKKERVTWVKRKDREKKIEKNIDQIKNKIYRRSMLCGVRSSCHGSSNPHRGQQFCKFLQWDQEEREGSQETWGETCQDGRGPGRVSRVRGDRASSTKTSRKWISPSNSLTNKFLSISSHQRLFSVCFNFLI